MNLLGELRERRVVRVLVAYLAGAWVAIEVTSTVAPLAGLPEWTARAVLTLAGAGLPPALLLAWLFDWSPSTGVRATAAPPLDSRGRRRRALVWGLTALATVGLAWGGFTMGMRGAARSGEALPERVVVAVFQNRTGDERLAALGHMASDWVTQGLLEAGFVEVADPQTPVALEEARLSAALAASPIRIGREAMARLVVSGSYYLSGDSLWINAEVVDVETGRLVAALPPQGASTQDPLHAVEQVRQRVTTALALHVHESLESFDVAPARPPPYAAYSAYVEGVRQYLADRYGAAAAAFDRATALDSTFHVAFIWAAHAYWFAGQDSMDARLSRLVPRRGELTPYDRARMDWVLGFRSADFEAIYAAAGAVAQAAPGSVNARRELALAALRTRRYDESLELFQGLYPFVGLMRSWSERYVYYTELLHLTGLHEREALVAWEAVEEGAIDRCTGALIRARAAAGRGDVVEALALVDSASQGTGIEELMVAREFMGHGRSEEGRRLMERAVATLQDRSPEDPTALVPLSIGHYALGRHGAATTVLDSARAHQDELGPFQAATGHVLLVRLAYRRGDMEEVRVLLSGGGNAWYMTMIRALGEGFVRMGEGERNQAAELLARFPDTADGNVLHLHLGADPDFAPLRGFHPFDALVEGR